MRAAALEPTINAKHPPIREPEFDSLKPVLPAITLAIGIHRDRVLTATRHQPDVAPLQSFDQLRRAIRFCVAYPELALPPLAPCVEQSAVRNRRAMATAGGKIDHAMLRKVEVSVRVVKVGRAPLLGT